MTEFNTHFYGHEISSYGRENGRVDYATFASAFECVLNNYIMSETSEIGEWEQISGECYEDSNGNVYSPEERDEKVEELEKLKEELEDTIAKMEDDGEEALELYYKHMYKGKRTIAQILTEDTPLERDFANTLRKSDILMEKAREKIREIEEDLEALEDYWYPDVYQWYIIDFNGAEICQEFGEIVYYSEKLNMYLWGVTHYGTAWSYVLTSIPCKRKESEVA